MHWGLCQEKIAAREILRLAENLETLGKSMVSSLLSWQRATATQGGSQRTVRNHARIPLKNVGIPYVPDAPSLEIV